MNYQVSQAWLNSARDNFVDNDPGNKDNLFAVGCETLFLYYLLHVVGKDIPQIVAAGADNLGDVYRNLTGKSDGWTSFSNLVADHFPAAAAGFGSFTYSVPGDNLFPVPSLTGFFMPGPWCPAAWVRSRRARSSSPCRKAHHSRIHGHRPGRWAAAQG